MRALRRGTSLLVLLAALAVPALGQPIEIQINNTSAGTDDYVTWAPMRARIRRVVPAGSPPQPATTVVLTNNGVGQVNFAPAVAPGETATQPNLTLSLPGSGAWVPFVIAGRFGSASVNDKDAVIVARSGSATGPIVGRLPLMVRVRKNANSLTAAERNRFLRAVTAYNAGGKYKVYQDIHAIASSQAHGNPAFLPWHRTLLLRLERELQAIDPSVTLPYWRFDQAAPNVFHPDFMGISDQPSPNQNQVRFSSNNPLLTWTSQGVAGVRRRPVFSPGSAPPGVIDQGSTLALGLPGQIYGNFRVMEGNPHGPAHTRAGGTSNWLSSIPTAVRDPLFFLLHANVDRLWAVWQFTNNRYDTTTTAVYAPLGTFSSGTPGPGAFLEDTMWPWNGVTSATDPTRPSTAPGGAFPASAVYINSPPAKPRPLDAINYRTNASSSSGMGFAYDDVPFR